MGMPVVMGHTAAVKPSTEFKRIANLPLDLACPQDKHSHVGPSYSNIQWTWLNCGISITILMEIPRFSSIYKTAGNPSGYIILTYFAFSVNLIIITDKNKAESGTNHLFCKCSIPFIVFMNLYISSPFSLFSLTTSAR